MDINIYFIEESEYSIWFYQKELRDSNSIVISKPYSKYHFFGKIFYRTVFSKKLNSLFKVPFKKWWFDRFFSIDNNEYSQILVQFSATKYYLVQYGYIDYLKKRYPRIRIDLILPDRFDYFSKAYNGFDLDALTDQFSSILTYNIIDSKKYGFKLLNSRVPDYSSVIEDERIPKSDVFFVGRPKGRLELLHRIYDECINNGLICDFNIIGVQKKDMLKKSTIVYNKFMQYSEVLKHCKRTKCILNVLQPNSDGITLRDYEAIGFNKILLTNSKVISSFEESKRISVLVFDDQNLSDVIRQMRLMIK